MWSPLVLTREAFRNLGPRHGVLGLAMAVTLAVLGALTALQATTALRQQEAQWVRGAAVWWVQSSDSDPVPAHICASLNRHQGVVGAGAVGREQVEWYAFDGARGATVDHATSGIWRAWGAPELEGRIVAGADVVSLGLVGLGSTLVSPDGTRHQVEAVTPPAVQPARLRSNVVVPRAADFAMSECWVRLVPGGVQAGQDLIAHAFAGHEVEMAPFVADTTALLSPVAQWRSYTGLVPGVAAGILVGLLAWLSLWSRRAELAVYRTFGTTRSEVAFLVMVELGLLLLPATAAGAAAGLAALASSADALAPSAIVETLAATGATVAAAALLGWALGTGSALLVAHGNLHDHLKDR